MAKGNPWVVSTDLVVYKMRPHSWNASVVGFEYCSTCGLVNLKNPITRWCSDKGCDYHEAPGYRKKIKELT